MSVGGASRTLAKLRELLDDDLFLRTNRGLVPTPRARELNGGVAELLVNYGRLFEKEVFRPSDVRRIFRILCVDNALFTFLTTSVSALLEKAPSIGVEFRPIRADFGRLLSSGEADFAIFPLVPSDPNLHSLRLADDVFVLVCGRHHPLVKLAQERTLTRKDFKAYRQIRVMTGPLNDLDDPWFDAEADIPLMAENIAVWSPFFIPIAQILCQTNLWGAVPLQLAVQLQKLMPDLIILGRPKNAVVYGPTLIWHNRTHQDPASVWVRSVIVSAPKTLADVNSIHFIED